MQLKHHGVKGMKWGVVRKSRDSSNSSSNTSASKRLEEIEREMSSTKDKNKLNELKKEYGKIEDSMTYSKSGKTVKQRIGDAGRGYNRLVQKSQKAREERMLERHNKYSKDEKYLKDYNASLKRTGSQKQAMRTAQVLKNSRQRRNAKIAMAATFVAASKTAKFVQKPETIRAGKNLIQALKNSPVRYVDGATLTKVINPAMDLVLR